MAKADSKAIASLGENMGDESEDGVFASKPVAAAAGKRIRIILDDNDEIPPTGHPVSVNGKMYILKANEEMDVPEEVAHVLDLAVMSVPVFGENQKVVGFRDRPRLPYRVIHPR
jgi:hypothetical protein